MKNKILILVVILIVVFGGYKIYSVQKEKKAEISSEISMMQEDNDDGQQKEATVDKDQNDEQLEDEGEDQLIADLTEVEEADLIKKCEAGQWVEIENLGNTGLTNFSGKVSSELTSTATSDENDLLLLYLNGKKIVNSQGPLVIFFDSRQVEIQGREEAGGIKAAKIRCTGTETDKSLDAQRQDVMNYIKDNINDLSPEKGKWEVTDFLWPNSNNIYVEYEKVDAEDDAVIYSLLLEVSKSGGKVETNQVAFMKMAPEDEDWVIVSGKDKFQDQEEMDYYEYNDTLKKWVKYE